MCLTNQLIDHLLFYLNMKISVSFSKYIVVLSISYSTLYNDLYITKLSNWNNRVKCRSYYVGKRIDLPRSCTIITCNGTISGIFYAADHTACMEPWKLTEDPQILPGIQNQNTPM